MAGKARKKGRPVYAVTAEEIMIPASSIPRATLGQPTSAIEAMLLKKCKSVKMMDYVYVTDKAGMLKGVVSIKELFQASGRGRKIEDIMVKDPVFVHSHTYGERAVYLALKHGMKAVPVLEHSTGKLLGAIPYDTMLRVFNDEFHKDFFRFIGMYGHLDKDVLSEKFSVSRMVKARLPWLIVGLIGGTLAASVVSFFEGTLSAYLALAAFMPALVYMSDAVGTQSETLIVRTMALDPKMAVRKYLFREFRIAGSLALICGMIIAAIAGLGWGSPMLGLLVGMALFFSILVGVSVSTFLPLIFRKARLDPAIATGPFATVMSDILTIVVYLLIASLMLAQLA